jgi:nucleoid DNA-binding protein
MKPLIIGDIIKSIRKYGLSIEQASDVLNIVLSDITKALMSERKVKLENLGKFEIRPHAGRKIKNINTKIITETKPYKYIIFSPCAKIKKMLNMENYTLPKIKKPPR